jgi:nucleoside-diphosphate-sugar epimerase
MVGSWEERLWPAPLEVAAIHRAWVLGATGFMGGAIARELAARGLEARGLRRWSSAGRVHGGAEIGWVVGDLEDVGSLRAGGAGCDVIFCATGPGVGRWEGAGALRASARKARNFFEAARALGPRQVVLISSAELARGRGEGLSGGSDRLAPGERRGASWGALQVWEAEALRALGQGLPVTVLAPGLCVGAGPASSGSVLLANAYRQGQGWAPRSRVSVLDVRDMAWAAVEAASRGVLGRWVLGGHNVWHVELARVWGGGGVREVGVGRAFGWGLPCHTAHLGGQGVWLEGGLCEALGMRPRGLEEAATGVFS